jgi:hypothetical protein
MPYGLFDYCSGAIGIEIAARDTQDFMEGRRCISGVCAWSGHRRILPKARTSRFCLFDASLGLQLEPRDRAGFLLML